ncbi:MAG TPA: nuclear transport factor 2 family protein [Micromonosporaceae bacterium]|jgi:hypothetical protein
MDGTRDIDLGTSEVEFGPSARNLVPAALRGKVWLALAGLVIALLAGQLWREHRQSGPERDAALVIEAYTAAWNAHDLDGVRAALAPGATFAEAESLEHPLLTATGDQIDTVLDAMFDAGVALETTGRITVVGVGPVRATVPQRLRYRVNGLDVVEDGVSLVSLVVAGGHMKIAQHTWWRPQNPRYPSMRWVVDSSTP